MRVSSFAARDALSTSVQRTSRLAPKRVQIFQTQNQLTRVVMMSGDQHVDSPSTIGYPPDNEAHRPFREKIMTDKLDAAQKIRWQFDSSRVDQTGALGSASRVHADSNALRQEEVA